MAGTPTHRQFDSVRVFRLNKVAALMAAPAAHKPISILEIDEKIVVQFPRSDALEADLDLYQRDELRVDPEIRGRVLTALHGMRIGMREFPFCVSTIIRAAEKPEDQVA